MSDDCDESMLVTAFGEWGQFAAGIVAQLAKFGDCREDLEQEAMVAILESKGMYESSRREFIESRLRDCRRQLKDSREYLSLNDPMGDGSFSRQDVAQVVDREMRVDRRYERRGPRKPPENKYMRRRHRLAEMGRCPICSRSLSNDRHVYCLRCRAIKSWNQRLNLVQSNQGSRRSKYDEVLLALGYDVAAVKLPAKARQSNCPHRRTKSNGKDGLGQQRRRCNDCGVTFIVKKMNDWRPVKSLVAKARKELAKLAVPLPAILLCLTVASPASAQVLPSLEPASPVTIQRTLTISKPIVLSRDGDQLRDVTIKLAADFKGDGAVIARPTGKEKLARIRIANVSIVGNPKVNCDGIVLRDVRAPVVADCHVSRVGRVGVKGVNVHNGIVRDTTCMECVGGPLSFSSDAADPNEQTNGVQILGGRFESGDAPFLATFTRCRGGISVIGAHLHGNRKDWSTAGVLFDRCEGPAKIDVTTSPLSKLYEVRESPKLELITPESMADAERRLALLENAVFPPRVSVNHWGKTWKIYADARPGSLQILSPRVVRFEVKAGDVGRPADLDKTPPCQRCEMGAKDELFKPGQVVHTSFRFRVESTEPVDYDHAMICQWHGIDKPTKPRAPMLYVTLANDRLAIRSHASDDQQWSHKFREHFSTPFARYTWLSLVMRSVVGEQGELDCWLNGEQVVNYRGPMGYYDANAGMWFQCGIYRHDSPRTLAVSIANPETGLNEKILRRIKTPLAVEVPK